MARKQFALFRRVTSRFHKCFKPIIVAVLVFALIVGFGGKYPLLANQSAKRKAADLIENGASFLERGLAEEAFEAWKNAENIYREIDNKEGIIGSQLNQGRALEEMGFYRKSCALVLTAFSVPGIDKCNELNLEKIEAVIERISVNSEPLNLIGLESLGNRLRLLGKLKESQKVLDAARKLAPERASIYLSLGNTAKAFAQLEKIRNNERGFNEYKEEAIQDYQKAFDLAKGQLIGLQAQLNHLSLLILEEKNDRTSDKISEFCKEIDSNIDRLSASSDAPSSELGYAVVNYAATLKKLLEKEIEGVPPEGKIGKILEEAIALSEELQNPRLLSFATGILGEVKGKQKLLEEALGIALKINAEDLAYRWEWQIGKSLKDRGDREEAIAYYASAFSILKKLRANLVALNRDIQFNFRDEIEDFYIQYADLLLQPEPEEKQPRQDNIIKAREVIEALQLAELDDFFLEACVEVKEQDLDKIVDEIDPAAAVVYSMSLEDKIAEIVKIANQPLYYYETPNISRKDVNEQVRKLRFFLEQGGGRGPRINKLSKELYRWLQMDKILELLQANSQIQTLVFVSDIELQNIPMAVLYDGEEEEYLLQKGYALVLAPGVQLLEPEPLETIEKGQTKVFIGGVGLRQNLSVGKFDPIQKLTDELLGIQKFFPTNEPVLDRDFTKKNLQEQLASDTFSIVHLKSHARFSSNPEKTFIVAFEDAILTNDLNNLIKSKNPEEISSIKLLVLSACETAEGDPRAALGLSGFALRAGARSTLSTLWKALDEENTDFMLRFYEELSKQNTTRARALHTVQLEFMEKDYDINVWSNYVLVGNWL